MINTRIAILELAARHRLDATALTSLWKLAALGQQPPLLLHNLRRYVALSAAFLGGLGLICMLAASWSSLGRGSQFALLQILVAACLFGTFISTKARQPFALFSLMSIGGLLAYLGQTYQTGADSWQLFALWAALALPLALAVRSDMVWIGWVLIAALGICLWGGIFTSQSFSRWDDHGARLKAALMMSGLTLALQVPPKRYTGVRVWSRNLSLLLSVAIACLEGFKDSTNHLAGYLLVLGLHASAFLIFSQRKYFNVLSISITGFGLNFLLLCKIFFLVWASNDIFLSLFLMVGATIGILSTTLWIIESLRRRFQQPGDRQ